MFVARWVVEAKFGHKDNVIALCTRWQKEVGDEAGLKVQKRALSGSVGVAEARLEFESQVASLAELEEIWSKMAKYPAHKQFGIDLEPHIISGSNHWEILRVVEGYA